MSLLSLNAYGYEKSPVTNFLKQAGIEGDFTIMQGETGFKAITGRMEDGKRVGEWRYYYPDSEQVWSVEIYEKTGKPKGVWMLYRKDGRIKMRDDLDKRNNDPFARPTPACMGPAGGYHSEGCIGNVKNTRRDTYNPNN